MKVRPVVLTGNQVVLEPLNERHASALLSASAYDEIWTFLDEPTPKTVEQITALIADAHNEQDRGKRLAFAVVDKNSSAVVGSTSYIDIRPQDRGLEIGWTWTCPSAWGTGVNTEAKYLLFRHAFEQLDAIRVAVKTDLRNVRSQRAIEAMGAKREGVWRNHRILSTGQRRDTVYYSVIDSEWPTVRAIIHERMKDQIK